MFAKECSDKSNDGCTIGEDANDIGPAFDFLVEALQGIVGPDFLPYLDRESSKGKNVMCGILKKGRGIGKIVLELIGDCPQSKSNRPWVRLKEDRTDQGSNKCLGGLGDLG